MGNQGASAKADQALAVPATPAGAVDGPAGFDPSRGVSDLLKRLRLKEHRGRYMPGGGTIDGAGKGTIWGGEKIMEPRNPDGDAAATLIEQIMRQAAAIERLARDSGQTFIADELRAATARAGTASPTTPVNPVCKEGGNS